MNLKIYKLIAKSDLYIAKYTIRAQSITDAAKQARVKFAKSYKVFGDKVKVQLDETDLKNHIDEILEKLHQ